MGHSTSLKARPKTPRALRAEVIQLFPGLNLGAEALGADPRPSDPTPTPDRGPDRSWAKAVEALAGEVAVELTTIRPDLLPGCLAEPTPGCLPTALEALGARIFRRPLTATERQALERVYREGLEARDHRYGVAMVIETLLRSPNFLYPQISSAAGPRGARASSGA